MGHSISTTQLLNGGCFSSYLTKFFSAFFLNSMIWLQRRNVAVCFRFNGKDYSVYYILLMGPEKLSCTYFLTNAKNSFLFLYPLLGKSSY